MKYRLLFSSLALAGLSLNASASDAPPAKTSTLTIGAGVGVSPRFAGSKENQVGLAPLLDYQHESGFFASTMRGIGWGTEAEGFKFSAALGARGERSDKKRSVLGAGGGSEELKGMGKVKASAVGLFSAGFKLGDSAELRAALELPLTQRDNGRALHLGAELPLLQGKQDSLSLSASASYGDGKYLRTYFGVTPTQSAASGYALFTPKAGFYKTELNLAWTHRVDDHWSVVTTGGVSHLLGDAGKSPLARRKTAPEGAVLLTYTY